MSQKHDLKRTERSLRDKIDYVDSKVAAVLSCGTVYFNVHGGSN